MSAPQVQVGDARVIDDEVCLWDGEKWVGHAYLMSEIKRLGRKVEELSRAKVVYDEARRLQRNRAMVAEAKLARVKALVDEWAGFASPAVELRCAERLRDAMEDQS